MAVTVKAPKFVDAAPLDEDGNPVAEADRSVVAELSAEIDVDYDSVEWTLTEGTGRLVDRNGNTISSASTVDAMYSPYVDGMNKKVDGQFVQGCRIVVSKNGSEVGRDSKTFPVFGDTPAPPADVAGFAQTADRYGTLAILQWTKPPATDAAESFAIRLDPTSGSGPARELDDFGKVEISGTCYLLVDGLVPGTDYRASIRGEGRYGDGNWAYVDVETADAVTRPGPPVAPTGEGLYRNAWSSYFRSNRRLYVWWREPRASTGLESAASIDDAKPGGDLATGYKVSVTSVSPAQSGTVPGDPVVVNGLDTTFAEISIPVGSDPDADVASVSVSVVSTNAAAQDSTALSGNASIND